MCLGDEPGRVVGYFAGLVDPREWGGDHDLLDIVVLALCAVMSGAESAVVEAKEGKH